jgi:predicted small lipoprotein YifL
MNPSRLAATTATCLLLLLLTGCGNKGDLYLPENPSATAPERADQDSGNTPDADQESDG